MSHETYLPWGDPLSTRTRPEEGPRGLHIHLQEGDLDLELVLFPDEDEPDGDVLIEDTDLAR